MPNLTVKELSITDGNFVCRLCRVSSSLIGSLFSMPRSIYSMASDGLLFRSLAHVHPTTQTPLAAIIISGVAGALMALVVEIDVLVEFLSIGTLMSFTIVAASVLILRYQPASQSQFELRPEDEGDNMGREDKLGAGEASDSDRKKILKKSQSHEDIGKLRKMFVSLPVLKDVAPGVATMSAVFVMAMFMVAFNALVLHGHDALAHARWWSIICLIVFSGGIAMSFGVLLVHETNRMYLTFQVSAPTYSSKYHSSARSAVSERPNTSARLVSQCHQLERPARFRFSNVPIRARDHDVQ